MPQPNNGREGETAALVDENNFRKIKDEYEKQEKSREFLVTGNDDVWVGWVRYGEKRGAEG
jgi:hypothetical protein